MAKEVFAQMCAALDSNRKIMKAGRDGRDVFLWVLRQIALRASEGWIPAREVQDAEWLSRVLMCKPKEARDGLTRALEAELLAIDGDRCIAVGWTPSHGRTSQSGAERQARYKDRKRPETVTTGDAQVTAPSPGDAEVTAGDEVTQGRKEGRKKGTKERTSPTRLPADWGPNDGHRAKCVELGVNCIDQAERFRLHHGSKGTEFVDWSLAFHTWIRNTKDFRRSGNTVLPFIDRKKALT